MQTNEKILLLSGEMENSCVLSFIQILLKQMEIISVQDFSLIFFNFHTMRVIYKRKCQHFQYVRKRKQRETCTLFREIIFSGFLLRVYKRITLKHYQTLLRISVLTCMYYQLSYENIFIYAKIAFLKSMKNNILLLIAQKC